MSDIERITDLRLDPIGGIAGDMFAAAMLDAFPDRLEHVRNALGALDIPAGVNIHLEATRSGGFRGAHFRVTQDTAQTPPRTLRAMHEFLDAGTLSETVRARAAAIFTLLAEAEAHVHGASIERVHFHEVSDWDSVVDVVSAACLIDGVAMARWRLGELPLGSGTVRTAHGDIPVPAPATAQLLTGFRWVDDGVPGERVTPTGAAIVRYLDPEQAAPLGGARHVGQLSRIGIGCGTRQLEGRANILRVSAFSTTAIASDADEIERLAFEIDDMTGEELAVAIDHLRATPGVLDVVQIPMIGKKGRSATGVRLVVTPGDVETAINACFSQTSTLGLRQQSVRRRVLPRQRVAAVAEERELPAKTALRPDGTRSLKVESDALASGATLETRRRLAQVTAGDAQEGGSDDD